MRDKRIYAHARDRYISQCRGKKNLRKKKEEVAVALGLGFDIGERGV